MELRPIKTPETAVEGEADRRCRVWDSPYTKSVIIEVFEWTKQANGTLAVGRTVKRIGGTVSAKHALLVLADREVAERNK